MSSGQGLYNVLFAVYIFPLGYSANLEKVKGC